MPFTGNGKARSYHNSANWTREKKERKVGGETGKGECKKWREGKVETEETLGLCKETDLGLSVEVEAVVGAEDAFPRQGKHSEVSQNLIGDRTSPGIENHDWVPSVILCVTRA